MQSKSVGHNHNRITWTFGSVSGGCGSGRSSDHIGCTTGALCHVIEVGFTERGDSDNEWKKNKNNTKKTRGENALNVWCVCMCACARTQMYEGVGREEGGWSVCRCAYVCVCGCAAKDVVKP